MVSKEELIDKVMTEIDAKCPAAFTRDEFEVVVKRLLENDDFKRGWEREIDMPIGKWLVKNEYVVKTSSSRRDSKVYSWGYTPSGKSVSRRLRFISKRRYRINRKKWSPKEDK